MQILVLLDRSRPEGLTLQIVEQIRDGIRSGRIVAGTRLPSSRRLGEQLDVSRNTAVRAYEILESEGFVEARAASGIYVTAELPPVTLRSPPDGPAPTGAPAGSVMPVPPVPQAPRPAGPAGSRLSFDFRPGRPGAGLFPIKTWRRLIQSSLAHGGALGLSHHSDPGGLPALRSAIAGFLTATRGIVADPGRIVIVAGVQEGLSIAARLFLGPGSRAVIENPCYQGAAFAFAATGAETVSIPVDEDGLMVDALPERPAALLYTTPSHQYPTGGTLPMDRRQTLVAWARRTGCHILEDDYDGDLRYEGTPLPAIAATAPDCTIHLGSFSITLGAGLRLGYMVVPPALVDAVVATKTLLDNGNPWMEQVALAEFIRSGSFASHVMRSRTRYRENRDTLLHALRRHFGDVAVTGEAAGLHLLWHLPQGVPEAPVLESMARKARIGLYSLASGGAHDAHGTMLGRRGILLGYGSLTPKQIEQGIARLSDLIDDTLDTRPTFVDELLVHEPMRPAPRPAPRKRQKPALRAAGTHAPYSFQDAVKEDEGTMRTVRGIYRYPVKGLSAQPVPGVVLEPDQPFPFDRVFALARPNVTVDREDPKWTKKGLFVMLMLDEALAQVRTTLDPDSGILTIVQDGRTVLSADLGTAAGQAETEDFFARLVPTLRGTPQLVRSRGGHFMDKPDNVLSLINLATVRSLEERWGVAIDPLRFRANFYVDGLRPWQEFDWIGSDIRLGEAVFRVDRRNGRCGATNVNPSTGRRDLDIPGSLRGAFGHKDLGVYLVTRKGGKVVVGDPLAVPQSGTADPAPVPAVPAGPPQRHRFICRGCYYIYDEAKGHPADGIAPGTAFADIAAAWRCPDCGTDKTAFQPYTKP